SGPVPALVRLSVRSRGRLARAPGHRGPRGAGGALRARAGRHDAHAALGGAAADRRPRDDAARAALERGRRAARDVVADGGDGALLRALAGVGRVARGARRGVALAPRRASLLGRAGRAMIDRDEVRHVARLARLELSDEEVDRMAVELAGVLQHISTISELDLAGVAPTSHVVAVENALRPDEPRPSLTRERALASA